MTRFEMSKLVQKCLALLISFNLTFLPIPFKHDSLPSRFQIPNAHASDFDLSGLSDSLQSLQSLSELGESLEGLSEINIPSGSGEPEGPLSEADIEELNAIFAAVDAVLNDPETLNLIRNQEAPELTKVTVDEAEGFTQTTIDNDLILLRPLVESVAASSSERIEQLHALEVTLIEIRSTHTLTFSESISIGVKLSMINSFTAILETTRTNFSQRLTEAENYKMAIETIISRLNADGVTDSDGMEMTVDDTPYAVLVSNIQERVFVKLTTAVSNSVNTLLNLFALQEPVRSQARSHILRRGVIEEGARIQLAFHQNSYEFENQIIAPAKETAIHAMLDLLGRNGEVGLSDIGIGAFQANVSHPVYRFDLTIPGGIRYRYSMRHPDIIEMIQVYEPPPAELEVVTNTEILLRTIYGDGREIGHEYVRIELEGQGLAIESARVYSNAAGRQLRLDLPDALPLFVKFGVIDVAAFYLLDHTDAASIFLESYSGLTCLQCPSSFRFSMRSATHIYTFTVTALAVTAFEVNTVDPAIARLL